MWRSRRPIDPVDRGPSHWVASATGMVVMAGLKHVGKPTAELVKDFLGRVLAPTGNALGEALAHPIVEWQKRRVDRAQKLVGDAALIVAEAGDEAQQVPGRVLWPLLERGSVEEDEVFVSRWRALLANAAMKPTSVLPAFASATVIPLRASISRITASTIGSRNAKDRHSRQRLPIAVVGSNRRDICARSPDRRPRNAEKASGQVGGPRAL
jgi:hypothetical protein